MSSYYKTCGISNLPIYCGDPVMVFTLARNTKIYSHCYTTALYSPVPLGFYSEYNDYGAGENSTGIALPLIIKGLADNLVEIPQGENKYHDILVTKSEFNEDMYWESIHEDRLKIKTWDGEKQVQFVMFHKHIVDHILANHLPERYVRDETKKYGGSSVPYSYSDILASIPELVDYLVEFVKDEMHWGMIERAQCNLRETNLASQYFICEKTRYCNIINIEEIITQLAKNDQVEDLTRLIEEHVKFAFIDSFMHSTRKIWVPGCHEGSQGSDDKPYRVLIDAMSSVLDQDAKKWHEEYDCHYG